MALVIHHIQGSYVSFPSRSLPWNKGMKLKRFVTTLHMVARTDRFLSLKCKSCLSVGAPFVCGPKGKSLRISAFKGSAQNDELGGRSSGSKSAKNSVKLSYIPQESEETLTESPKEQNVPLSYASDSDERIAGSLAIQNLFKNWLALLRTPSPNQVVDEILEGPAPKERSEMQNGTQKKERSVILKAVWCYFLGLDATVKIPLLIFIPWYLAVNVVYGAEVSKELTPLWVLGPLIVALYIKMLRSICAFYVFSFKQTVKVVKNLPTYYLLAYNYIARGKLKEDVRAYFWQPVMNIKNLDYKELSKRKMKDLQVWAVEKYLDYVESIWPYYCRTIRFLKRANLI
uniref:Embryo defective 2759 n=2 Tax=Davidia involucrata TaxID=16924 RepID=A0A5B7AHH6_DAVIN